MISVALCTFNGERYLPALLASLGQQNLRPLELVVCDDGSTDGTWGQLEHFAMTSPFPVHLRRNAKRLGVQANFQAAASLCRGALTAFADQDDIWLPEKLARAAAAFAKAEKPAASLYCTRLTCIDAAGTVVGRTRVPACIGFRNALVENIATGCSVVFGASLKTRFLAATAADMEMHDWWLYLLASSFGEVFFDSEPGVLYRQHENNVAGWQPRLSRWRARILRTHARLRAGRRGMDSLNQAARFVQAYPDCPSHIRTTVQELLALRNASLLPRLARARKPGVARNDPIENLALRAMIALGIH
jgi:glycosyltransferase involved in cell wall biosynthesis